MLQVAEVLLCCGQHGTDYDGGLFGRALRHHRLGEKHSWLWLSHDILDTGCTSGAGRLRDIDATGPAGLGYRVASICPPPRN